MTSMAIHPSLDLKFGKLRSGHKSYGDGNERYYIVSLSTGSLPGGKVLSGWNYPHHQVSSPRIDCLELSNDIVDNFIAHLYS